MFPKLLGRERGLCPGGRGARLPLIWRDCTWRSRQTASATHSERHDFPERPLEGDRNVSVAAGQEGSPCLERMRRD